MNVQEASFFQASGGRHFSVTDALVLQVLYLLFFARKKNINIFMQIINFLNLFYGLFIGSIYHYKEYKIALPPPPIIDIIVSLILTCIFITSSSCLL